MLTACALLLLMRLTTELPNVVFASLTITVGNWLTWRKLTFSGMRNGRTSHRSPSVGCIVWPRPPAQTRRSFSGAAVSVSLRQGEGRGSGCSAASRQSGFSRRRCVLPGRDGLAGGELQWRLEHGRSRAGLQWCLHVESEPNSSSRARSPFRNTDVRKYDHSPSVFGSY